MPTANTASAADINAFREELLAQLDWPTFGGRPLEEVRSWAATVSPEIRHATREALVRARLAVCVDKMHPLINPGHPEAQRTARAIRLLSEAAA